MSSARIAASAVLVLRIAYGVALIATPARLTQRWLGRAARRPPTQVALRGLGAREVLVHAGGLRAALTGAPVRPWLAASVTGDAVDIAATAAGRGGLPSGAMPATVTVAGLSAALTVAVAGAVDE